jgi:hypothetical protein
MEATAAPPSGQVSVSVATTLGSPIPGAAVSLTSGPATHTGTTDTAGILEVAGAAPGAYSLLVELDGWIPERLNFTLGSEARAEVQVTMLERVTAGGLRVKLAWGGAVGRDLDLHILQVARGGSQAACLTFWHNDNGCPGTKLDQNVGLPGEANSSYSKAETITIEDFGPKLNKTFMIFVDDHTTTGSDFGLVTPHLTLSDGLSTASLQMPGLPADAEASARCSPALLPPPSGTGSLAASRPRTLDSATCPWTSGAAPAHAKPKSSTATTCLVAPSLIWGPRPAPGQTSP